MPDNNPATPKSTTLYVVLHHADAIVDVFANKTDTTPLGEDSEVHVDSGGQINVEFINNRDRKVLTGKLLFTPNEAAKNPFASAFVTVHEDGTESGKDKDAKQARHPARIPHDKAKGSYRFTISASWKDGDGKDRHTNSDPIVVIDR